MIIAKRRIKINFDEADTKKSFADKLEKAIGNKLLAQSNALDMELIKSGKIINRKRCWCSGDVNCYFEVMDIFKDFDTYEEVINEPINIEVKHAVENAGFRYETEIKYYSNEMI